MCLSNFISLCSEREREQFGKKSNLFIIIESLNPHMKATNISVFFLVLVALGCCFKPCVARDTITFNSLLPDDGTTLISAAKRFELGFFNPIDHIYGGRYVGIWYYNLSPRTVVWVANRDKPLKSDSGCFAIVEDGNLKLLDGQGKSYFNSSLESSSYVNRTLKLLDSGNLALLDDRSGNYLWQSFAEPTDTFLPGMKMDENLKLVSWNDSGDPGTGSYMFQQDEENNKVLKIMKGLTDLYWKSGQLDSIELPFSVAFFLSNFSSTLDQSPYKNSDASGSTFSQEGLSDPASYAMTRLLMNSSGEIQFYIQENQRWSLTWSEPNDACSIYNPCGYFGIRNLENGSLNCECLAGFEPVFPETWKTGDYNTGCKTKLALCNKTSEPDTFLNLRFMKVTKPNFLSAGADSENACRQQCLSNCECQAYYYADGVERRSRTKNTGAGCKIWTSSLTNLQKDYIDGGHNLSIRVAVSSVESTSRDCEPCGTHTIQYPLSTGTNCGDPSYYSFSCNGSTDQLSFLSLNHSYEVISITQEARRFVVQVNSQRAENCGARTSVGRVLQLNQSLPFSVTNWCYSEPLNLSDDPSIQNGQRIEIGWNPPSEPICFSANDCQDWPDSTCAAKNGTKRCLCNSNYQWNNLTLKCVSEMSEGSSSRHNKQSTSMVREVVIIVTTVIAVVLLAGSFSYFIYRRRILAKRKERQESIQSNAIPYWEDSERQASDLADEDHKIVDVPYFSLDSILAATSNFSDQEYNSHHHDHQVWMYHSKFLGH